MSVIIRLQNLPLTAGASDVRVFFSGLKIPDGAVHIVGGAEGDAFIGFASDEDARQAMQRDHGTIHQNEVRLLLSSRTEMNSIIDHAKTAVLQNRYSPVNFDSPVKPKPANEWSSQHTGASEPVFPPPYASNIQNRIKNEVPETRHNEYDIKVRAQSSQEGEKGFYRGYMEKPNSSELVEKDPPLRFFNNGPAPSVKSALAPPVKPKFEPPLKSAGAMPFPPQPKEEFQFIPEHLRPPFGIPPSNFRAFPKKDTSIESNQSAVNEKDRSTETRPLFPPPRNDSWRDSSYSNSSNNVKPFAGPSEHSERFPPRVPPGPRKPLLTPKFGMEPLPVSPFIPPVPPQELFLPTRGPSVSKTHTDSVYVELSRLPNEMLRPASLEEFVRPKTPLCLSSVKVVFGPQNIHLHTLVRFDNVSDAEALLNRDGEMGIKVRSSTKREFDEAVDGMQAAMKQEVSTKDNGRRSSSPRRRRRRDRRERTRSPPRRRRRSRSRSPIRPHKDINRWCLQMTNVPFKVKEEDLLEWMSEKVRPSKLSRTYYADGNASDRWIAEFESESMMNRARSVRSQCLGRTIRMCYIDNETADELLKIQDCYGNLKRIKWEEENGVSPQKQPMEPGFPGFPTGPPPSNFPPGPMPPSFPMFPYMNRGGPARRGSFVQPLMGMSPHPVPPPLMRGGMRGRGRGRGFGFAPRGRPGFHFGDRDGPVDENALAGIAATVGSEGTVISCRGFPPDTTLEDVLNFFAGFNADSNSVLIRMGEDGVSTGECLLSVQDSETARKAVKNLNGMSLRGCNISLSLAP